MAEESADASSSQQRVFFTNPLGLSEQRLQGLAKEGIADAFTQLTMVAQVLRESLSEYERQGKDGRNVVIKQLLKRPAQRNLTHYSHAMCNEMVSSSRRERRKAKENPPLRAQAFWRRIPTRRASAV